MAVRRYDTQVVGRVEIRVGPGHYCRPDAVRNAGILYIVVQPIPTFHVAGWREVPDGGVSPSGDYGHFVYRREHAVCSNRINAYPLYPTGSPAEVGNIDTAVVVHAVAAGDCESALL